jgi:hypothetical protein
VQNQQSEDSRGIARQQKNTERYLAKKQMLMGRKDDFSYLHHTNNLIPNSIDLYRI